MSSTAASGLFSLRQVSHTFPNGLKALEAIDLTLARGAFVALVGPSGCGKSTILRLAARLVAPTAGEVTWTEAQPRVGMVFQDPTLMPWARIDDNVALPLRLSGAAREPARAQAEQLLARVGLTNFSKAYPAELSGGMKMRASLARALITDPHALLLDEPFAALDEITRLQLNEELLALWLARKPSILFVTHSVFEAVFLAQEVQVLSQRPGHILERIRVEAPYPRSAEFRLSPAFAEAARAVSQAIARGFASDSHAA